MSTKSRFEKQLVVNHRTPSNSPITQKPVSAAPRCSGPGPSDDSSGAGRIRREPSKRPCRRQRDTSDSNSAPRRYSFLFYRRNGKVSISLSSSAVCVTPLGKALLESGASPTVGVSVVDQRPSLVTPLEKALLESGAQAHRRGQCSRSAPVVVVIQLLADTVQRLRRLFQLHPPFQEK